MTRVTRILARPLTFAAALAVVLSSSTAPAKVAPVRKLPAVALTDELLVIDGEALVPIEDLAGAALCKLERNPKAQSYEAWPCKNGGVLEVDKKALAKMAKLAQSGKGTKSKKALANPKKSPGSLVAFDPQPEPPMQLLIGTTLVSTKLVPHGEGKRVYLPLSEVAKLMGGTVHREGTSKEPRMWIEVPPFAPSLVPLRLGPAAP